MSGRGDSIRSSLGCRSANSPITPMPLNPKAKELLCPVCGDLFFLKTARRRNSSSPTCSRHCAAKQREAVKISKFGDNYFLHKGKMRAGGPETSCAVCGKIFRPLLAELKRRPVKCCGSSCASKYRSVKLAKERNSQSVLKNGRRIILASPRECLNCRGLFTPLYHKVKKGYGLYCCVKCRSTHLKTTRKKSDTKIKEASLVDFRIYPSGQKRRLASERPCLHCAKLHRPLAIAVKKGVGQFCAASCRAKYLAFQKAVTRGVSDFEVIGKQRVASEAHCLLCSKFFRPTYANLAKGWGKFCSKTCASKHRAANGTLNILQNRPKKVSASCNFCHKPFFPKKKASLFCSRKCGALNRSAKTNVKYITCLHCGKSVPTQHKTRRFCTRKCWGEYTKAIETPSKALARLREKLRYFCYGSLQRALKGQMKQARTRELLGYTVEELRIHLESQFQEGMGWHNWSKYGWHIDHVKPVSSFPVDASIKDINALQNLRPLWWRQNLLKSSRVDVV